MAPTGINRPGFSSSRAPTGTNRPGYSSPSRSTSVFKSKPSFSSMPQAGGSSRDLERERQETRDKFFGGRNIPGERADRRRIQDDLVQNFIATQMKPVSGSSNLLQKVDPTGMGLTEYRQMIANKYGPTLREVAGDIGYGIRQLGSNLAKVPGQMFKAYQEVSPVSNILRGIQSLINPQPPVATYGGSSDISVKEIPLMNNDLNVSVNPGASAEFLAAINAPGTMAQDSRLQELLKQNVPGYERIMNLGDTPYGNFGIENLLNDPRFTYERPLGPGQLGIQVNPFSQSGGFSYGMQFKNGGIATLH